MCHVDVNVDYVLAYVIPVTGVVGRENTLRFRVDHHVTTNY